MALAVKDHFGVGSKCTIQKIIETEKWSDIRRYIKPFLTPAHMMDRKIWCTDRLKFFFFSEAKLYVRIDEKWFYSFREGKVLHCPPNTEIPKLFALSKTQIPKVMFLGAVAPPLPKFKFDGRIGLWTVSEKKVALKNSKFHEKGEEYEIPITMDGELFVQMMKENVIPAIREKCSFATLVEVQLDSAGGHKVNSSVSELNIYCSKSNQKPKITFVTQPTRSPDLNVLDLGIWNSLQTKIPTIKYEKNAEKPIHTRIIEEVVNTWNKYNGAEKLKNIFETLSRIFAKVVEVECGNVYKIPRSD